MQKRIEITRYSWIFVLVPALLLLTVPPVAAQYGGYGGMYSGGDSSGSGSSGPDPTPTPDVMGRLTLSASYLCNGSPCSPRLEPGAELVVKVYLSASGSKPGDYSLAATALTAGLGNVSPSRGSMSSGGVWTIRVHGGSQAGSYQLLIVAQDRLRNHKAASKIINVTIVTGDPVLLAGGGKFKPEKDTRETRKVHRSWWKHITTRSSSSFEYLCEDLSDSWGWKQTIAEAVKIDRDRINITKTMPPIEEYKSYTNMVPIMNRYWADTGITLSTVTANRIGDVYKVWRGQPELVLGISEGVGHAIYVETPTRGVKVGRVLNGVGATMILLDFWSNMSSAETPAETRDAWNKAGYASIDLYMSNLIANTFGAAAALPGMWASYMLSNSYDTLISGHKNCWFKKMVAQALAADLLSNDVHDPRAVNKVKAAMTSPKGLKKTLKEWWTKEGPIWDGKQGGCGNWNLAVQRGYTDAFVDRLIGTSVVEIDGKRIMPWSFYSTVSQIIVRERRKEMAREAAEKIRDLEAVYISTLEQKSYRGTFRLVSAADDRNPIREATVCPTDWDGVGGWDTGQDGWFTAVVKGHHFSPDANILLTVRSKGKNHLFIISRAAFEEVPK